MSEGIEILTDSGTEPVTLEQAKLHLRLDTTQMDSWLTERLTIARYQVEEACNWVMTPQTVKLTLDDFPQSGEWRMYAVSHQYPPGTNKEIILPRRPLVSVTSIVYNDGGGTATTMPATDYKVDTATSRVAPAYGETWPATRGEIADVAITYSVGWSTAINQTHKRHYELMRQMILLLLGDMYEHLSTSIEQRRPVMDNPAYDRLLAQARDWRYV